MSEEFEPWAALRPDAQAFDEVRIVTVPRYKESYMSGDEWRISASLQYYRKGELCHEVSYRNVETACIFAAAQYLTAIDEGKGYFAGIDGKCDQEGCCEPPTVKYFKKHDYSTDGEKKAESHRKSFRQFCDRHKKRGDCGLDDADANYQEAQA